MPHNNSKAVVSTQRIISYGKCPNCSYEITKPMNPKLFRKIMDLHMKHAHKINDSTTNTVSYTHETANGQKLLHYSKKNEEKLIRQTKTF